MKLSKGLDEFYSVNAKIMDVRNDLNKNYAALKLSEGKIYKEFDNKNEALKDITDDMKILKRDSKELK